MSLRASDLQLQRQAAAHKSIGAGVFKFDTPPSFPATSGILSLLNSPPSPLPLIDDQLVSNPKSHAPMHQPIKAIIFESRGSTCRPANRPFGTHRRIRRIIGLKLEINIRIKADEIQRVSSDRRNIRLLDLNDRAQNALESGCRRRCWEYAAESPCVVAVLVEARAAEADVAAR